MVYLAKAHHSKIHMLPILERIKQTDQPRRLDRRQNIPLHQYMLHLVHLGQRAFPHLFERAHLVGIILPREVDRAVPALSDLRDDAEMLYPELGSPFSEDDALAAVVRGELAVVV